MKKCGFGLLVCLFLVIVSGCSAKLTKPEWRFGKDTVRVHIKADHKLNLYNSKAHTLYVCFYQLSELNAFDQLTQDEPGIRKLLECKLFDGSVAAVKSKIIHAGENLTIILDRAERAKYFAMVTGYFSQLDNARMVRRHKIQVLKKRTSFWKNRYQCMPCDLDIEVALGPNQIDYSKIIEKDEGCKNECR
ncbi:MAG: type VI secretion lipoprotein TssJ [Desulfobacteraceae bacterium]|jgi:predicted component of type VI protein secretion system